jgi:RNA polymerase sigma-70 factor (ECF subfamily)
MNADGHLVVLRAESGVPEEASDPRTRTPPSVSEPGHPTSPPTLSTVVDHGGFDRHIGELRPELVRYLRSRVNNEADAADLVQETCSRVVRYRNDPQLGDLRSMMFRIANNLLVDFYRSNSRHHADAHVGLEDAGQLAASDRPQLDQVAARQALATLKQTIIALPPKCRLVFMLSRFDGMQNQAIAQKLDISIKMVEKHIARAMVACRAAVGDRDA